ncbi:MAG: flagellar biosynthesis protein FlhB [Gammaproteobacteria bacterium]|nr:flagellar biosynthesis protein FlhB [Gammaproteobacteria bacterium]
MAEQDSGERSEQATPRKIQKAKEKGQVPRSRELTTAFVLLASPLALLASASSVGHAFNEIKSFTFSVDRAQVLDVSFMMKSLQHSIYSVFASLGIFFGTLFVLSLLTPVLIGGLTISAQAIAPKMNKLSPKAGFKRMFGTNAAMELLKAIGKFLLIAIFAWLVLQAKFDFYLQLGRSSPQLETIEAINSLLAALLMISAPLVLIALIDVPFQLWNHAKQLKMTKQETKDEYKETEGKPEVKGKIRQTQRELTHRRMMEAIPDADVVVTNPEHYSVALKYDQFAGTAPVVVAKGADLIAFNIRKVAKAHHVPIMEAPPLARAIYHTTKLDQEIPEDLYLAVAQVLAYVMQLNEYQKGKAVKPKPIKNYPIPEHMKY